MKDCLDHFLPTLAHSSANVACWSEFANADFSLGGEITMPSPQEYRRTR